MNNREASIKVIAGCCAAIAKEMVAVELAHHGAWMRERKGKNGKKRAYEPALDLDHWTVLFEDFADAALSTMKRADDKED